MLEKYLKIQNKLLSNDRQVGNGIYTLVAQITVYPETHFSIHTLAFFHKFDWDFSNFNWAKRVTT